MSIVQYFAKRIGLYLVVLFIGITITFFLPRLMPTNPIDGYIGQLQARANQPLRPEAIAALRSNLEELYGLKGDIFTQYFNYINRVLFHFDFGPSFTNYPEPVSSMILNALPWTLGLLLFFTLFSWVIGNLIGLVAGYYHNKRSATVLEVVGILLYPIPYYILALTVILLLAYFLPIFPLSPTFPA